jgi:phosphatidylethanolamine-binding protein (PEBP) family uncharacterized protein
MNLRWEDGESSSNLSKGFAWVVYPGCEVALATVLQDREVYGDDFYHWDVTDLDDPSGQESTAKGVAASMKEAKAAVESALGMPIQAAGL